MASKCGTVPKSRFMDLGTCALDEDLSGGSGLAVERHRLSIGNTVLLTAAKRSAAAIRMDV